MSAKTDAGADLTAEVDLAARPVSTDLHDPAQRAEVERALTTVPGVLGARLVAGFEREVDELHVLTTLDRSHRSRPSVTSRRCSWRASASRPTTASSRSCSSRSNAIGGALANRVTIDPSG